MTSIEDLRWLPEWWRPVPDWESLYEVSSFGGFRSLPRRIIRVDGRVQGFPGKIIKRKPAVNGYRYVLLCDGDRRWEAPLHSVVATTFHGPPVSDNLEVRHLDGDPLNCVAWNLSWGTHAENMQDTCKHGTSGMMPTCSRGHAKQPPNLTAEYFKTGARKCLSCVRARAFVRRRGYGDIDKIAHAYFADITKGVLT